MSSSAFDDLIGRAVEAATAPLRQTVARQEALLAEQAVGRAMEALPAALAQYAPGLAHLATDPEFQHVAREAMAGLPPEVLRDRRAVAAAALQALPLTSAARRAAPAPSRPAAPLDADAETAAFVRCYAPRSSRGAIDAAEAQALDAVDDHSGLHTLDAYKQALARGRQGRGGKR
jgi:hypothetical protein